MTDPEAAELHRLRARMERARRLLHETGDPWAALGELGLVQKRRGRRRRSLQEREQLAGLYTHMTEGAGPPRPAYGRPERMDLLHEESATWIDYQAGRGLSKPKPDPAGYFTPDCDVPMAPADALRNVAAYLGVKPRTAWDLLKAEGTPGLPPRPR